MKYLFVLSFIIVFIFFDTSIGYTTSSPIYTHITYIFQHVSILHLTFNSFAFLSMYISLERFLSKWVFLPITFTIGIVVPSLDIMIRQVNELPTVGASAVIYAMIGLYIGITLLFKSIKIADTQKYLLFLLCIAISLLISLFKENSSFIVHFLSFVLGGITSVLFSIYKNLVS